MSNTGSLIVDPVQEYADSVVEREERLFELAQRKAQVYAKSSLVPKEYQNNVGNVLIAQNMASRMGADVLMVMQNLYVVHGRPGWSSQFLIATFNQSGKYSSIKYRFSGAGDEYGCEAYCTELSSGEEIVGTKVTWKMVKAEGWHAKNGSKWNTIADQMFRYRAAAFLIRTTAPQIAMGLVTVEELDDVGPQRTERVQLSRLNALPPVAEDVEVVTVESTDTGEQH